MFLLREYLKRVSASYILFRSPQVHVLSNSTNFKNYICMCVYICIYIYLYIMDVLFGSVYEEMKKSGKNETMTKQKNGKKQNK